MKTPYVGSRSCLRLNARRSQRGFTLIELLIGGAILLVLGAILSVTMLGLLDSSRGSVEGRRIATAAQCGAQKARSMGSSGSATFAVLLNNACFGRDEGITNIGQATASLDNTLTRLPYIVSQCTIDATNDGVAVETRSGVAECPDVVEAAAVNGAVIITVTPSGGSAAVVKTATGKVDLASAGLTTACKGTAPIAVRACVRY